MILQASAAIKLRPLAQDDSATIYQTIAQQMEYLRQWLPFVAQTPSEQDTIAFIKTTMDRQQIQNEPSFCHRI